MNVPKGYKMTEVGLIPEDWSIARILEVAHQIMDFRGRTPKKLGMTWGGGDIPALSANNVKKGFLDLNEECYFGSEKLYSRWMTQGDIAKDDILFTTEAPLGNVALVPDDRKYILSQRTVLIKVKTDRTSSLFLFQYLLSDLFQRILVDYSSGSTAKGIQRKKLEQLSILLPPLPEQRSIARVLSDTDALINALDKLIAKKRDIKKAVMQELLTGKTRLPGFSGEWEVKRLGDLFNITAGKDLIRDQYSEVADNSFPFPIYSNSLSNFGLYGYSSFGQNEAGCITVTARGTLGYACYRTTPFVAIGRLLILKPKITLNGFFISELINHCIEFASESTGVPQLTSPQISKYELSIPSPEEQQAIAQILSDIDSEITALEKRRDKMKALKQGMMQELLTGRIRLH